MNDAIAILIGVLSLIGCLAIAYFGIRKIVLGAAGAVRECANVLDEDKANKLAETEYTRAYIEQNQIVRAKQRYVKIWKTTIIAAIAAIVLLLMYPPAGLFVTFLSIFACGKGIKEASANLRIARQEEEDAKYPEVAAARIKAASDAAAAAFAADLANPVKDERPAITYHG